MPPVGSFGPLSAEPSSKLISQKQLTFLVHPPELTFRNYDSFKTYEATISFQNQTNVIQDVKVIPPDSRFFSISAPRAGSKTLKVSAGLSVSYTVKFTPEEDKDYYCDLVCVTEQAKFIVPIQALSARGTLDFAPHIKFEAAPVKFETEKTLYVRNIGRKAAHFNLSVTHPWAISPPLGALEPDEAMQFALTFTPEQLRKYEGELEVTYSNGDKTITTLVGEVQEVNLKLETVALQLEPTFISLERQAVVQLTNRSDIPIKCKWKQHESREEEEGNPPLLTDYYRLNNTSEVPFQHPVFTVEPLTAECRARSVTEFVVTFNPQMAIQYDGIAYLDVVGKEDRIPLKLAGSGIGPQCCFSYDALDLGDVFINSVHIYEVMLENRGSIEARFNLTEQRSLLGPKFTFTPSSGTIQPGEAQVIDIKFSSDIIGIITEAFSFEIKGATNPVLLHFKGRVIGPTFHFDVDDLDFGHVPFNFVNQKTFHVINTSEIPMRFTLRVPEDGEGDEKEFDIVPSTGVILPHGRQRVVVDFLSNTVQEYHANLIVDIDDVGDNLDSLPIRAICLVPDVSISMDSLDFGQCFVGYPYKHVVEIQNDSHLAAKYEVVLPPDDPVRKKLTVDVETKKGIVNLRSIHKLTVTMTAKATGSHHMPLYIKILGSDKPPFPLAVSTRIIGPVVHAEPLDLAFGKVNVLENVSRPIQLINKSPIPANFTTSLKGKSVIYSLPVGEGTIPPESSMSLQVGAFLDEVMKFTEELLIHVEDTGDIAVKLVANGKGTTVVPSIPMDLVDFGNQFTTTKIHRTFVLHNRGRKPQQIVWQNERGTKLKEGDPPFTFFISPDRATILPKSEETFTIEGFSEVPGEFKERFSCKLQQTHKVIYQPQIIGQFHVPLLQFSHNSLVFQYTYDKTKPTEVLTTKPLTLKNVSPLVLHFTLKAGNPFGLDRNEYVLAYGESATVHVDFDASYKGDRLTHKLKTKLTVIYKDHPQKDSVDLIADVSFPNLQLDSSVVDFGCVLNETERKVYINITNCSKVDAVYSWAFEDGGRPSNKDLSLTQTKSPLNASIGGLSPLPASATNIFDILPVRGFLSPGQSERVEFMYFGHAQKKLRSQAVCQVEGGPDYAVKLVGEASSIQFKFDKNVLEFGSQNYDRWEEKELYLFNAGRVSFNYSVDLSKCSIFGRIDVQPREGVVNGNDKVRLIVKFCPKVPDRVEESFSVQVAHFDSQSIKVSGCGLYSTVHMNLPRSSAVLFQTYQDPAKETIAKSPIPKYWLNPEKTYNDGPSPVAQETEMERLYFIDMLEEISRRESQPAPEAPAPSLAKKEAVAAAPTPSIHSRQSTPAGSEKLVDDLEKEEVTSIAKRGSQAPTPILATTPQAGSLAGKSPHAKSVAASEAPVEEVSSAAAASPAPAASPPIASPSPLAMPVDAFRLPNGETKHILTRYICDFGPIVKGDTKKKSFKITNDSHQPLSFNFDKRVIANSGVTFTQDRFLKMLGYPACSTQVVECTLETKGRNIAVGNFRLEIPIDIKTGPLIMLEVRAEVIIPSLQISMDRLDFGTVRVGQTRVITIELHNPKPLPCEWHGVMKEDKKKMQKNYFMCMPESGTLAPGETTIVQVSFIPLDGSSTSQSLLIRMNQNPRPATVACKGQGEDIQLEVVPSEMTLGPVLPFSNSDINFQVINRGTFPVEFFVVEFDRKHLVENDILRASDGYVNDVLLLDPRTPGESLPDGLLESYYQKLYNEDLEFEKIDHIEDAEPTPDTHSKPATPAPEPEVTKPGPVIVITGPPLSGKTSACAAFEKAYGWPVLTIEAILDEIVGREPPEEGEAAENSSENAQTILKTWLQGSDPMMPFPEEALVEVLQQRLAGEDVLQGVIFDGLYTLKYSVPADMFAKCIRTASNKNRSGLCHIVMMIEAQLIDLRRAEIAHQEATDKLTAAYVEEMPEDVYDALSPAKQTAHQKALQKQRAAKKHVATTSAILNKLKEDMKQDIANGTCVPISQLIEAEEEEERLKAEAEGGDKKKKKAADDKKKRPGETPVPEFVVSKDPVENFKRTYTKVKKAFSVEVDPVPVPVPAPTGKGPKVEDIPADIKITEIVLEANQAPEGIYSDLFTQLEYERVDETTVVETESVVDEVVVPDPFTKQRLERPSAPTTRNPILYFNVLTPQWIIPTPSPEEEAEKEKKKKAASKKSKGKEEKEEAPPEEVQPVLTLVEGKARWIVEGNSSVDLVLRFMSDEISSRDGFLERLRIGVVGSFHQYPLILRGICQYPEICKDFRNVFPRRIKSRPEDKFVHKQFVVSTKTFEFGPLLCGRKSDGYLKGEHPENCETMRITNNGMYEALISFCFEDEVNKSFLVNPKEMTLKPEETQELRVWAFPDRVGLIENAVIATIKDSPEPVRFDMTSYGAKPEVEVDASQKEKTIDFDRLLLRTQSTITTTIKNISAIAVSWKFGNLDKIPSDFTIFPVQGILEPKEEVVVSFTFVAHKAAVFNQKFELQVTDTGPPPKDAKDKEKGPSQTIPFVLVAEGFDVFVETTKSVDFGTVKVALPATQTIQMLNRGKYDVAFNFKMAKKLHEVFKLNPMEGILKPKDKMNVELLFSTKREIVLNNNQDMEIRFNEPRTNEQIGSAPIPISVKAFFNTYLLTPAHGINFGPCLFNAKKTATFEIANQGPFDIQFRLFSLKDGLPVEPVPVVEEEKAGKKGGKKPPPKKQKDVVQVQELTIGKFIISPSTGLIPVKGSATITVSLNPEGNQHFHERLGIDIADRDPNDHPQGIPYELEGESCVPGIHADLDSPESISIFEEQQIVSRLDPKNNTQAVFARDERIFSFGTVVADGRRVQEKLKLINPNKVGCVVSVKVKARGESRDAQVSAEAFDVRGYEVQQIPPHEHRYVYVGFRPQALTTYYAIFEATIENGLDSKTKELKFELRGDGALPQILVELPPAPMQRIGHDAESPLAKGKRPASSKESKEGKRPMSKDGKGKGAPAAPAPPKQVTFQRTIVGEEVSSWIRVCNNSELAATIRFTFPNNPAFSFPQRNEDLVLPPKSEEQYNVYFTPLKAERYEAKLNLIVPENRFEDTALLITGEGYDDEITFSEVEEGTENFLNLGDCAVNICKDKKFTIVNHSDNVMRFQWTTPGPEFGIVPQIGHIQPKASKDASITYITAEPQNMPGSLFVLSYKAIKYLHSHTHDWDDRLKSVRWTSEDPAEVPAPISPTEDTADEDAKLAAKGKKPAAAAKGKKGKPDKEEEERLQREKEEEEKRRLEEEKRKELERLKEVEGESPKGRRKPLRKVIEVEKEPAHESLGQPKNKELIVRSVCAYTSWAIEAPADLLSTGIKYRTTKMFQTRIFKFPFTNTSTVEMRYHWRIREMDESEEEDPGTFNVKPDTGLLAAGATQEIEVGYSPLDIDGPHRKLLLGHIENLEPEAAQPSISLTGSSECPLVHFELPPSDYLTGDRRPLEFQGPGSKLGNLDTSTLQIIEFESRGIRIRNTKRFYVLNPTTFSYEFEWVDETGDSSVSSLFHLHTPRGVIHSGKKYEMVFDYTPETLDIKECFFKFNIQGKASVPFLVVGSAVEPDVYFDKARLNFGSVLLGAKSRQSITIQNKEDIPFAFAFDKVLDGNTEGQSMVSVSPATGTVAAGSSLTVEVIFCPTTEEVYNYNLVCRVKKKTTFLTCNIKGEGYTVHENMVLQSDHDTLQLQPGIPNTLDFGRVHINDSAVRTVILSNSGRYNIDYKWTNNVSRHVTINPEMGLVAKGEKCVMELTFHPTNECTLDAGKVLCKITNGRTYALQLVGSGSQPLIHFSFKHYDFGSCFLKTAKPYTATLIVSNRDIMDISFDVPWENKEHLEVQAGASMLQPGESKEINITFMPKDVTPYNEVIPFEINGLYTVPVSIVGEGTIPRIELVNPAQKILNFGAIRVGEVVKKSVKLVCKSKVPTRFSLDNLDLSKSFVQVAPRAMIELRPKEQRTIDFTFAPTQRLRPFNQDVYVQIAGIPRPLLSIAGAGQGIELHLDVKTMSFGPVVHGTSVTKRILLFNTGDLGVKFAWDSRKMEPDFAISPAEGFVQAHNEVAFEITYTPNTVGRNAVIERVQCRIREDPKCLLELNVNGQCVDRPPVTESLKFQTNVRKAQTRQVAIKNPTGSTWHLKPQVDNESWTIRPQILDIKSQDQANLDVTYYPTVTTKIREDQQPEQGSLFIPLPTGEAKLYHLEGVSEPPLPAGEIERSVQCKTLHTEKIVVTNWLKKPQKFKVSRAFTADPGIIIKGIDDIDIPPLASRDYKFTFMSYKDTRVTGTVTFTNEETREYLFYNCTFKTLPAATIDTISFRTPVRQKLVREITLENPLSDKQVTLTTKCDNPDIAVPATLVLPPDGESKLSISYFPLLMKPQETIAKLTLSCPELGDFPYSLKLSTSTAGPEKYIRFNCPLGSSQTQTLRFVHFSKANADFVAKFTDPKPSVFYKTNGQYAIKVTPVAAEGAEVTFDVTYEPCKLGDTKETLSITSATAGDYAFSLLGTCTPPERQGPVDIKSGTNAQIPFKNVFAENTVFTLSVDHPAFNVNKSVETIQGKKSVNFTVAFKPVDDSFPVRGKLIVGCNTPGEAGKKIEWVYYLRGLKSEK